MYQAHPSTQSKVVIGFREALVRHMKEFYCVSIFAQTLSMKYDTNNEGVTEDVTRTNQEKDTHDIVRTHDPKLNLFDLFDRSIGVSECVSHDG